MLVIGIHPHLEKFVEMLVREEGIKVRVSMWRNLGEVEERVGYVDRWTIVVTNQDIAE